MKYLGLLIILLCCVVNQAQDLTPEQRIESFYQLMQEQHGFTQQELDNWFDGVEVNQKIIESMNRPAEKTLTWAEYRNLFVKDDRINQGIDFWSQHQQTLAEAEKTFGVPASLIVGLMGVETRYGKIMGSHDIFRSLYTFAFHYPRRATFFTRELTSFLVLAKQQGWAVGEMKGSYAGAMGYGQFMPSSYQAYAVDFDADGHIHLVNNVKDAIGSVANYIHQHRWQSGGPTVMPVKVSNASAESMLSKGLKPDRTLAELKQVGVAVPEQMDPQSKVTFFKLDEGENQYWIGFQNFYAVSRYNPRIFYTKAVLDLASAIETRYQQSLQTTE